MNQKTFEELVNDSTLLNRNTQSELEQLLKEYPFCQTFHLLYTKNLYQLKDIRYNQQLKVAATVAGDRTRLKYYIEDLTFTVDPIKDESNVPAVFPEASDNVIDTKSLEVPLQTELSNTVQEKEEIAEELPTVPLTNHNPELKPSEAIPQQENEDSKSAKSVEWDAEYESVLLSNLNSDVSREEKKKAIIALINKKFAERDNVTVDKLAEKVTEENDSAKLMGVIPEIYPAISDKVDIEQTDTIEPANEITLNSNPVVDVVFENNIIENDNLEYLEGFSVTDNLQTLITKTPVPEKKEVIPTGDLIEKFLRDAPRMPRPKKEFFNPVNLAARSIEENEDFYTETYASICLKQGNATKAIKIYEKLSLKFPEKSSYFAGLIEKINKEQNI
jgi:hypothetical protein